MAASQYLSQNRPMGQNKTTYGHMNEWMHGMMGRTVPRNIPVTMSDGYWQKVNTMNLPCETSRNVYDRSPEERFRRSYQNLTQKIAYRYPDPGTPRVRQGRIGGSWRHIKEVLGHGGGQICFVDGLVRLYDSGNFNDTLTEQSFARPHVSSSRPQLQTPRCSLERYDISDHQGKIQTFRTQEPKILEYEALPKILPSSATPQTSGKYKGFYRLK